MTRASGRGAPKAAFPSSKSSSKEFVTSSPPTGRSATRMLEELRKHADPRNAEFVKRYFKTGPGDYGEGDKFLGIRVPIVRSLARRFRGAPLGAVDRLLTSEWHEARLLAVIM